MNQYKIEVKWALIFLGALLLWMTLERLLGWHDEHIANHAMLTIIFIAPAIVIYYLALKDKRDNYFGGKMSWKQGALSGVIMTLVITVLTPIAQYIIQNYITPHYFDNIIAYSVDNGMMEQEAAAAYFNGVNYIKQATIGSLSMGIVTSAIVALVTKRS